MYRLSILSVLAVVALFNASTVLAQSNDCSGYKSGDPAPAGYGAAWNTQSPGKGLLVQAYCTNGKVRASVGAVAGVIQAIYQKGYYWSGSDWKSFQLFNNSEHGARNGYFSENATATFDHQGDATYFVGYVCVDKNSSWKCGCSNSACTTGYWQLQMAVKPGSQANQETY
jgi:hypothetical protein